MSPNDIAGLCERLKREVPSGRYTIGSGSLSSDGKFSGTPSLPIMTLVNPDGPEAVTALAELSAKLDAQEGVADRAHSELAKADEALTTATARIAELEGALVGMIESADWTAQSHNTGMMDQAIENARESLERKP